MAEPHVHQVATTVHGRYVVDVPAGAGPHPVLLGFHGYGESAAIHLAELARLDPGHAWLRVSVQGLHRFYTRTEQVVASWMTREDRLEAIADNIAYAGAVRAAVARDYSTGAVTVVAGFSQGAGQAYRTVAAAPSGVAGVIALGGDVPPEVDLRRGPWPPVLIGRGRADAWYTAEKLAADRDRLSAAGVEVSVVEFDGGHEWGEAFVAAAGRWLAGRRR